MRRAVVGVVFSFVGLFSITEQANAQTVRNPTVVEWTVSADHAQVTRYEMGFFLGTATEPVQSGDLGTCTPDAQQKCTKSLPSYPIGSTYNAKVRAYGGTVVGDWSPASNEFYRTPLVTLPPVVR
jgi:hypothetical protein